MNDIERAIRSCENKIRKYQKSLSGANFHRPETMNSIFLERVKINALRAMQDVPDTDVGKNAPLTLDELRQMNGEPVWVVCDKGFEPIAFWVLVEVCEESIFLTHNLGGRTEYASDVELEDDGITAYRHRPEEGTV